MPGKPRRVIRLTDPRALRAVAHPVRLSLIGLLRREGPLTATKAGEFLGESPASCSFHLRQLAKYGLVEEAGGGRARERPWRATAVFTNWPDVAETPEMASATKLLNSIVIERYFDEIQRWTAERTDDEREWQEASGFGDTVMYLTPKELARLKAAMESITGRYVERRLNPQRRPAGSRPARILYFAFPAPRQRRPASGR